jgi:endonuclease V-like protein UPF0215 family
MGFLPLEKKGFRVLGIAESFDRKRSNFSIITGVVMRRDLVVDGIRILSIPIGGKEITNELIGLYLSFRRNDIRAILLQGTIISWFNIVDMERFTRETGLPVVSVTYDTSDGIERYLREYFPQDYKVRLEQYNKLGTRR